MKANEVPKRIYCESDGLGNIDKAHNIKWPDDEAENIEYVRIDAFIEKVLAYLNSKFYFHNAFYGVVSTDFSAMEELFEDFVKYMKGDNMTKEIEEIKECDGKISSNIVTDENNWYVCIKQLNNFEVGKVYCIGENSVITVPEYFRLATDEEISQGASMQNTDTTEPTGVRLEKCPKAQKGE